jgi:hypothetical protein
MTKLTDIDNPRQDDKQEAEERLMHALLHQTYQSKASVIQKNEIRIQRVMVAIDDKTSQNGHTLSSNLRHKIASSKVTNLTPKNNRWMGLAASLIFVISMLSFLFIPTKSALAEVNQILEQLAHIGDRLYRISVITVGVKNHKISEKGHEIKDTSKKKNTFNNKKPAENWLDNALLFVRNSNQYLLQIDTDQGRILRARNNSTRWKIDSNNSIKHYKDQSAMKLPFSSDAATMTFMDLPKLLTRLTENYDLNYHADIPTSLTQTLSLIVATKKSSEQKGVKAVSIYYQANSYLIDRIVFDRIHMQGSSKRYKISLQLLNTERLDEYFFTEEYHLNH